MTARIFISYRTADGMDKATALARDLGRVFGHEAVFLDKDDLAGGSSWRAEIGRTLQERPVLLLLMTPQLIEATGADGRLRIDDPADPVRREFEAALEAGAHVIPVLCDGLAAAPDASKLPAPFNHIGELTWRKLRAYDWAHDVERLVVDLQAFGVAPVAAANTTTTTNTTNAPSTTHASPTGPRVAWAVGLALGLALIGGLWWLFGAPRTAATPLASAPPAPASATAATTPAAPTAPTAALTTTPPAEPAPPTAAASPAVEPTKKSMPALTADLSGRWAARLWQGEKVTLVLTQTGDQIRLASEPVPITQRADWAEYRAFWLERTGAELRAVMYRGDGSVIADPGAPRIVDIALKVLPSPGGREAIDGGNLSATLSADGRKLSGTIWRNGAQAQQPATLTRIGAAPK